MFFMLNIMMSPCPCTFLLKIKCPNIAHQGASSGVEYYHLRFIVTEIKLFSVLGLPPQLPIPNKSLPFLFFLNWYTCLLFLLKTRQKRKHKLTPSLYLQITGSIRTKNVRQRQEISESSLSD